MTKSPGEESSRLCANTSKCYSTLGQKNYTMEAVEDGETRLVYGAQDHAMVPRRERCHVRYEDSGGVSVLFRRRLVQKQYFGIRQQLKEVEFVDGIFRLLMSSRARGTATPLICNM